MASPGVSDFSLDPTFFQEVFVPQKEGDSTVKKAQSIALHYLKGGKNFFVERLSEKPPLLLRRDEPRGLKVMENTEESVGNIWFPKDRKKHNERDQNLRDIAVVLNAGLEKNPSVLKGKSYRELSIFKQNILRLNELLSKQSSYKIDPTPIE